MKLLIKNRLVAECISSSAVMLMAIGAVMVFSASVTAHFNVEFSSIYKLKGCRPMIFFPLALAVMWGMSRLDFKVFRLDKGFWRWPVTYMLILSVFLLVLVLSQNFYPSLPNVVPKINYHYRWIRLPLGFGQLSFQVSELAKWSSVLFVVGMCDKYFDELKSARKILLICSVVSIICGLIIIEDFGTAAFIVLISFILLIIAGARLSYLFMSVPFGCAAFYLAIIMSPTRVNRILAFLHPEKWTDSVNYQANQSLIAIGSGAIFGKGLGRGICKYGHLPEDTTDFIFSIISEELGLIGAVTIILLFIFLAVLGIVTVSRCKDRFGKLLTGAIVLAILIQAAINIGVATVVLPTKGIPLPFVSSGGTSVLLSAAILGILINITKTSLKEKTEIVEVDEV